MALKDQPYFPFYVKDFDGDEKLKECDAESHGVYIRILCLMHKSKTYGKLLLRQKYWQTYEQTLRQDSNICHDFAGACALMLLKHLPFTLPEIERGLCQLLENEVLFIENDYLCQKRMIKDGQISQVRASAGKKGAIAQWGKGNFAMAKSIANGIANNKANGIAKEEQITAIAFENVIKGNDKRGVGGEEEENENLNEINYYIGNWHLETTIEDCLKYYKDQDEFKNDRNYGCELFAKQYVVLPDDEIFERLFAWGKRFNEATSGKYSKRPMRGENSWVQHFHNWLKGKTLSENPNGNILNKKIVKEKTAQQILAERGML